MTSEACRAHGIEVVAEARQHDVDGLVEAIVETLAAKSRGT